MQLLGGCFISCVGFLMACQGTEKSPTVTDNKLNSNESNTPVMQTMPLGPAPVGTGVFVNPAPQKRKSFERKGTCQGCDIYIVSVCSLRKDYVGAYGGEINTPNIDKIAKAGVRFERAYSASNFTLAGLTAVLTGRFPSSNGVSGWNKGLSESIETLPEVLGYYGYNTAAFSTDAASGFRPDYGLDQGFQTMTISMPPPGTPDGRHLPGEYSPGEMAVPMSNWLKKQPIDKPVFVMLHTRTAHYPFVGDDKNVDNDPTGLTRLLWKTGQPTEPAPNHQAMPGSAGGQNQHGVVPMIGPDPVHVLVEEKGVPAILKWKELYLEAVEKMDADIGLALSAIQQRGRMNESIIVLLGDHGESLNDHGEILHGDAFFDSVINVPFIIQMPNAQQNKSSSVLASHVDLMPTLLEAIGAMSPATINGVSLNTALRGENMPLRTMILSEGGVARHDSESLPGAVIAPPWALLKQRRGCGDGPSSMGPNGTMPLCLFNIENDPKQLVNLASNHPEVVTELLTKWTNFRNENHTNPGVDLSLSTEFIQELRQNGYDFNQR